MRPRTIPIHGKHRERIEIAERERTSNATQSMSNERYFNSIEKIIEAETQSEEKESSRNDESYVSKEFERCITVYCTHSTYIVLIHISRI